MKLKYRCGRAGCRKVHTLSKAPGEYRTERKCSCGGTLHDYSMDRRRNKARTCGCDGLPYPHKKGSDVWCPHHPTGPTEEDFEMRYGR
jgi:hypothetical protein